VHVPCHEFCREKQLPWVKSLPTVHDVVSPLPYISLLRPSSLCFAVPRASHQVLSPGRSGGRAVHVDQSGRLLPCCVGCPARRPLLYFSSRARSLPSPATQLAGWPSHQGFGRSLSPQHGHGWATPEPQFVWLGQFPSNSLLQ
jgi:hypothetical protein